MSDILTYKEVLTNDPIGYSEYPEGVIQTVENFTEMKPQSVVYVFQDNTIPPIACDLDYLYAQTKQRVEYDCHNEDKLITDYAKVYVTDTELDKLVNVRMWSFRNRVKQLIFKYGLKNEYYKNIHGKWIDMGAVRPHLGLANPQNSIFYNIVSMQTISDLSKDTSIYVKLCDNKYFSTESWSKFRVKDINDIPSVEYIVKETEDSNDGIIYNIKRGDGTYELDDVPVTVYEQAGEVAKDAIHTKDDNYAKFIIKLGNYSNHSVASGTISDNDHEDYNDLYITFYKADGITPYTDLDNMFIVCNNMILDYKRSTKVENAIFIPNAVKYAEIQRLSTSVNPSGYLDKTQISPLQLDKNNRVTHILNFDIPNTEYGYSYKFEIKMYKWNNVSVSHFTDPLNYVNTLKGSTIEVNKSFWLKTGADFSKEIDKSRTLLICGNEIIPNSDWEVDIDNPRRINFLWMSKDFDILYSEIYTKISDYMAQYGKVNAENKPKIEDYLDPSGKYYDVSLTPIERFNLWVQALNDYVNDMTTSSVLPFDAHHMPSVFDIVKKQFMYKQFAIITFDTLDEANYTVELYDNHDDIHINKPYNNCITNKNWSPDDILVVNGLVHTMENLYADVFRPPTKWYLPVLDNVFDGADVYKLQVKRRNIKKNYYMKLNYTELLAGPLEGYSYYTYDKTRDIYTICDTSNGFEAGYARISSGEAFNTNKTYFTKNSDGEYVKVPSTETSFIDGVTYYEKIFAKTYYVLK
jgi:hypothetical protein